MISSLNIFGLRHHNDWLDDSRKSYRPPHWPPPSDWVVSEDREGKVFSYWADSVWNLSPWAGKTFSISFSDNPNNLKKNETLIDRANADILRLICTWRIWGIKSCNSANGFRSIFFILKQIITTCSINNITASNLSNFPNLIDKIAQQITPSSRSKLILELHRLLDASQYLGFILIDSKGIQRLSQLDRYEDHQQTAYIPARIWTYIVLRFSACIEDYLANLDDIENCFEHCLRSYQKNTNALAGNRRKQSAGPFNRRKKPGTNLENGSDFHGHFGKTAEKFRIDSLLEKWVEIRQSGMSILHLTSYMGLVQTVCAGYIASFTLQRIDEVGSLRYECLLWEEDGYLGRILTIVGSTTKTDQDSDARWITTPNVEKAVRALKSICKLRMLCNTTASQHDRKNPYLFTATQIPWSTKKSGISASRVRLQCGAALTRRYSKLFDKCQMLITSEDHTVALKLTPNLKNSSKFVVGNIWPFTWHQLRRTGAVNMFASGVISDSTLQFLMKHVSRLMPLYYGRGYTKLLLNEETSSLVVKTMYETMALRIETAMGDRFISPLGKDNKDITLINLIGSKDIKQLTKAAERGTIFFRETLAGACTHRGVCEYGGIESISRCAGSDGNGPCPDALYDREKIHKLSQQLEYLKLEADKIPSDQPRHQSLVSEALGLEYILNALK
ncbi:MULTISPECIES: hypothetical protein [Pseudomonas]|nr:MULTISPECIES: hypothetical protein [Pseudomonas]MDD2122552.1 hypothetical protein [Pseudomonas monteilii]